MSLAEESLVYASEDVGAYYGELVRGFGIVEVLYRILQDGVVYLERVAQRVGLEIEESAVVFLVGLVEEAEEPLIDVPAV